MIGVLSPDSALLIVLNALCLHAAAAFLLIDRYSYENNMTRIASISREYQRALKELRIQLYHNITA